MKVSQILDKSVIKLNLESSEKEEVLEELVGLLERAGKIQDHRRCMEALLERERLGTTGIGDGIAIPHAKDKSVPSLSMALGISRKGVAFESIDGKSAHVIFLVMAQANNPGPHISLLAEIARLFQTPHFYEKLLGARSEEEVLETVKALE